MWERGEYKNYNLSPRFLVSNENNAVGEIVDSAPTPGKRK